MQPCVISKADIIFPGKFLHMHNISTLFPIPEFPLQEKEQIPGPNANLTEQNSDLEFRSSKRYRPVGYYGPVANMDHF